MQQLRSSIFISTCGFRFLHTQSPCSGWDHMYIEKFNQNVLPKSYFKIVTEMTKTGLEYIKSPLIHTSCNLLLYSNFDDIISFLFYKEGMTEKYWIEIHNSLQKNLMFIKFAWMSHLSRLEFLSLHFKLILNAFQHFKHVSESNCFTYS